MSKALIAIVGPSGSGKSSSLRNLDPASTGIIDLERKGFPFPQYRNFKFVRECPNIGSYETAIKEFHENKEIKVIVVESLTKYFEHLKQQATACYKGYDVWNYYNKKIRDMLDGLKNDKAVVICTATDEIVKIPQVDGSELAQRRIWVQGKEHEGKIEKEFLMVLFTDPRKDKDGNIQYHFMTNTDGVTSAKTPMEMFKDRLIPNDVAAVIKRGEAYYEEFKAPPAPPATPRQ